MHSQKIGKDHEDRIADLLNEWNIPFVRQKPIHTLHETKLTLDFWIPKTTTRPSLVIEGKTFGVNAKNPNGSRKRKVQEALWLLVQVRRYCQETQGARIILVTGATPFLDAQIQFLKDEIGQEFHIVSIDEPDQLKRLVQ